MLSFFSIALAGLHYLFNTIFKSCECTYVHTSGCVGTCRSWESVFLYFWSPHPFQIGSVIGLEEQCLARLAGWLAGELQECACLYLPALQVSDTRYHAKLCMVSQALGM